MNNKTYIFLTEEFGRGVYASTDLPTGSIISLCDILPLSEKDTVLVNETDLKYYTFKFTDNRDCLVLGEGELYNHSDEPNVSYELIDHCGRKVMMFKTLRPVKNGEQLFINYEADSQVNADNYTTNILE